jgi:hypothetical protein
MSKPIAWSYSSLNQYLTCGKQYHEVRVLKNFKEAPSEQLLWGERVHKFMEQALNEPTDGNTGDEFKAYRRVAERFAQTKGQLATEQQLAITNSFKPTAWFAPDVWCRGVLDAIWIDGPIARVVDWKTGKRKPDSYQLKLFALLTFAHHPKVNRVNTAFVWLQTGKMDTAKFLRKDVPMLWQDILPNVRRLEYAHNTQTWIPKPSGLCRGWCPVKTCSFWDGTKSEPIKTTATA